MANIGGKNGMKVGTDIMTMVVIIIRRIIIIYSYFHFIFFFITIFPFYDKSFIYRLYKFV